MATFYTKQIEEEINSITKLLRKNSKKVTILLTKYLDDYIDNGKKVNREVFKNEFLEIYNVDFDEELEKILTKHQNANTASVLKFFNNGKKSAVEFPATEKVKKQIQLHIQFLEYSNYIKLLKLYNEFDEKMSEV